MSEGLVGVIAESMVSKPIELKTSDQVKKELIDPKTISKNKDQEGRDKLASEIQTSRQLRDEVKIKESELGERQESLIVKLKSKLHIPDKQIVESQAQLLEQRTRQDQLPNPKQMVDAYYEKVAETPLTNQEKRDLLKPEVLSQLSTDEYLALWKRLNPYFISHVTRQGFRDHTGGDAMVMHTGGYNEFTNGFTDVMKKGKELVPFLAMQGLTTGDKTNIEIYLSQGILQSDSQSEAESLFNSLFVESRAVMGMAPYYPDKTAMHFAVQIVSDRYYGGEQNNEVFFLYPSDVLASQYDFSFNGREKDLTRPQSEVKWNDIFVWPGGQENPGISVDSGMVFLPGKANVDPSTGSRYASEIVSINGKEKRIMVENKELINKFLEWSKSLTKDSEIIKRVYDYSNERNYFMQQAKGKGFQNLCIQELEQLGFDEIGVRDLAETLTSDLVLWKEEIPQERLQKQIEGSSARFKMAEKTVPANEYWEEFFTKNPTLRPKHVVYYDGDPTSAVYRFQEQNGIGRADTSKTEGQLLGFDDHHIVDKENDPRSNKGHKELVEIGNRIIEEHYKNRI